MRILGLTNFYPPLGYGYGAICRDVMRALAKRGHDVRVLCAEGGEDETHLPVERSLAHMPGAWRRPLLGLRAERVTQAAVARALDAGADGIIAWHMRGIGKGALALAHRSGVPVVYALGDLWAVYERPGPPAAWRLWSALDRHRSYAWLRERAGAVAGAAAGVELRSAPIAAEGRCAFTSHWLRERYAAAGFVPADGHVVPNGISLDEFPWPPRGHSASSTRRLLFAGRVDASKGADVAVDALSRLPGSSLTMAGGVDPSAQAHVASRALGDRVQLLGEISRDEVLQLLAEHDVFLMPGRIEEGFGLVYLEAMASGLPVVGTATGGAAEFCVDGRNALLTPPDPSAVAAAVERLTSDHELRERLVEEGRRTAERHSLETMVDRLERLLSA